MAAIEAKQSAWKNHVKENEPADQEKGKSKDQKQKQKAEKGTDEAAGDKPATADGALAYNEQTSPV
jgi:hypothetical protein